MVKKLRKFIVVIILIGLAIIIVKQFSEYKESLHYLTSDDDKTPQIRISMKEKEIKKANPKLLDSDYFSKYTKQILQEEGFKIRSEQHSKYVQEYTVEVTYNSISKIFNEPGFKGINLSTKDSVNSSGNYIAQTIGKTLDNFDRDKDKFVTIISFKIDKPVPIIGQAWDFIYEKTEFVRKVIGAILLVLFGFFFVIFGLI